MKPGEGGGVVDVGDGGWVAILGGGMVVASKLPRVPRKVTPVESDIRPIAVSLAASLKQEPSTESHSRFW